MSVQSAMAAVRLRALARVAYNAQELRSDVVDMLSRPGSGPGGRSAPGEPPAVDTGQLRASIQANHRGGDSWGVGTNVAYAPELEFGRRNMAPRPFFRPSVELLKQKRRR